MPRPALPLRVLFALIVLAIGTIPTNAQVRADAAISGIVVGTDALPVSDAIVELTSPALTAPRLTRSDSLGAFRVAALPPGVYSITVRRLGFKSATLPALRVLGGRVTDVRVELTQSPTRLSTVTVLSSPTQIDVSTPAMTERFTSETVKLLPTARDAAGLVALVPGARVGQIWGGGGDVANNVQLDGISVSHPGEGGDFLRPSVDWIESLEVIGLGAAAEHGNFQGGIINAITRSGGDRHQGALRVNLESSRLTGSNFNLHEEGSEQAGRREVSGEFGGPLIGDRLHYFVAGQTIGRDLRVPDLRASNNALGFRDAQTNLGETRGLAKLTWRPEAGSRLDFLVGGSTARTERLGLNGADDVSSTQFVEAPTVYYGITFTRETGSRHRFDARIAGFVASERRRGYAGPDVPAVRFYSVGREPGFQNADFNERRDPSNLSLKGSWSVAFQTAALSHRLKSGVELGGGRWARDLTRNGGLTWRPLFWEEGATDPLNPTTWAGTGSDWGGEMRLRSEVRNAAVFVQDEIAIGSRLTLAPGIRWGAWEGILDSKIGPDPSVRATGWDPRIGAAWDILGDGTTALKAHWGRYHQGMSAALFDRLAGSAVYSNERFYINGPGITDPRTTFTLEERDLLYRDFLGVPLSYAEKRFDETGIADGYRQPYVDQLVLAAERTFGPRWKIEAVYTTRRNRDIVGLVDRNLELNHWAVRDVAVRARYGGSELRHPSGAPLTLPVIWVNNRDLRDALILMRDALLPPPPGMNYGMIATLVYDPDFALTTIPDARRSFDQAYLAVRTEQARWNAAGSIAFTRLTGNVEGVTGYEGAGSGFRAGGWVRPNEGLNSDGHLGNTAEIEAKMWAGVRLKWGIQGGATLTHATGERITPYFEMEPYRYQFSTAHVNGSEYNGLIFRGTDGQVFYVEERGRRGYADRTVLDLHLERRFDVDGQQWLITLDLFNALAEDELTKVQLALGDGWTDDPTTLYGAARQRVAPRRLRIGTRVEF